MTKENRKCYFLHAICSLILILGCQQETNSKAKNEVPKPENKVPKPENKVLNLENKVLNPENKV